MGLFENLFGKKADEQSLLQGSTNWETLTVYRPSFRSYNERLYESDLVVAAIDARARHFSKLNIEFMGSAKATLRTRMKIRPNSFQTWSQFLYRLSVILDMQGTVIVVPTFDKFGQHNGYFPILPSLCTLVEHKGVTYIRYKFKNGKNGAMELDKVAILTRNQYEDDIFGTSPVKVLPNTLGVMDLNRQGIKEAIKSSAIYKFMAQVNNFTKTEDLKKERKRFTEENLQGEDGGLLLFPNTYNNIKQLEPKNYILDEKQMSFIRTSVFDFYGVSEAIIQNRATKDEFEAFYEGAIEPLAIQFCQTLTMATYTEYEQAFGNRVQIYTSKLARLTVAEKYQAFDRGILTVNEAREEILGLPPVEGGDIFTPRGEYHDQETDTTESEGEENAN